MALVITKNSFDYTFKIVLIGDSGTGKTCLGKKFINGASAEMNSVATIGANFLEKTVLIDGKKVRLQIWDTEGQERFHSVTRSYYRNADGAILVYDVTRRSSFLSVYEWVNEIKRYSGNGVLLSLVGNKADLESCREVGFVEAEAMGRYMPEVLFAMETSAKEYLNIEEVFMRLATELKKRKDGNLHDQIGQFSHRIGPKYNNKIHDQIRVDDNSRLFMVDENIVRLGKSPAVPESKCCK